MSISKRNRFSPLFKQTTKDVFVRSISLTGYINGVYLIFKFSICFNSSLYTGKNNYQNSSLFILINCKFLDKTLKRSIVILFSAVTPYLFYRLFQFLSEHYFHKSLISKNFNHFSVLQFSYCYLFRM